MGKALDKLVSRTSGEKKKKPRTKKKSKQEEVDPRLVRSRNIAKLEAGRNLELRDAKLRILEKLKHRVAYQKKQRVMTEGMIVPGLALEGEESDDDDSDDPY